MDGAYKSKARTPSFPYTCKLKFQWKMKAMNANLPSVSKGTALANQMPCQRIPGNRKSFLISESHAVLSRTSNSCPRALKLSTDACSTLKAIDHQDNWFDCIAINYLTVTLQNLTGKKNKKHGYEGLLEATRTVARDLDPAQQHELVIRALHEAIPHPILSMIKGLLPNSKFAREVSAAFTTLFFVWLVGPSEVRESEIHGRREKSLVYIKKCRFLEGTNCAGMCINLCKFPTQKFIKSSLGMPVTLVPNFEDMSCKMIFGEEPPSPDEDPASRQPCYKLCEINKRHNGQKCST